MQFSAAGRRFWGPAGLAMLVVLAFPLRSLGADAGPDDGGASPGADVDAGTPLKGDPRAAQIRSLIAGTLPVQIEPQSLFSVPIADEPAQQVERLRLATLLGVLAERADAGAAPSAKSKVRQNGSASKPVGSADAALLSSPEWQAREQLDHARLEYYSLSKQQRDDLLSAQSARVEAAKPKETDEERHAREAEDERKRALQAAQVARTEAERLVSNELARLIGIEQTVSRRVDHFEDVRVELASREESLPGWQKRVKDARATTDLADETYDALRRTLRASREELDRALDEVASAESTVPEMGQNPLTDVPPTVAIGEVSKRRTAVEAQIARAHREERAMRVLRASTLLTEIDALNFARLSLLSSLSTAKRSGITGFTEAGLDQSRSEARQLLLVLRYHRYFAQRWLGLGDVRNPQRIQGVPFWGIAAVAVPWLLGVVGFVWLRRRTPGWLTIIDERLAELERREQRPAPSPLRKAARFLMGFHRPLESLMFFALTVWLLPPSAQSLLEFQLAEAIVGGFLGGALIVNVINAIAGSSSTSEGHVVNDVAALRLRSLKLVGRTIVAFALVLLVSDRLVGKGTLYSWVYSTCWFAAVPVFLILVRWWREIVFQRIERVRRKSELQAWILANRSGWKSFFAAMVAAVQLFAVGIYKTLRNWITSFNLARRAHAYLFRRELARLKSEQPSVESVPLSAKASAILSPANPPKGWVSCLADVHIDALAARVREGRGGVVAIVGERGIGKTSLLRRLEARVDSAAMVECQGNGDGQLQGLFPSEGVAGEPRAPSLVLLDDAERLIRPLRGGLRLFEEALSFTRSRSEHTLWVFAIDAVVWPFLRRACDSRPLFEEIIHLPPWTDEQIGELLSLRSAEAELTPNFEDLLERLPASADEIDRQEAIAARSTGYFRMVWDYTRGNPAMALEVWRSSLSEDKSGVARVRSLAVPDSSELDGLPDSALFILRAVLQLEPATVSQISKSTRITEAHVLNAVTFGVQRGYLDEEGEAVRVAWAWLRSIVVLLERRHLLVNQ
ncbi:MAG TPA: hypothetical protein VJV79_40870 [Polyangiaceae bacterium]|nr:hypothetical protein [Polyangiaceae bacterium]